MSAQIDFIKLAHSAFVAMALDKRFPKTLDWPTCEPIPIDEIFLLTVLYNFRC